MIPSSSVCQDFFCALICNISWRTVSMCLRRTRILLLLSECSVYVCQALLVCSVAQVLPFLIAVWSFYLLKSFTNMVLPSVSSFNSVNVGFIHLGAVVLGTYILNNCYILLVNGLFYHYVMTLSLCLCSVGCLLPHWIPGP